MLTWPPNVRYWEMPARARPMVTERDSPLVW